MSEPFEHFHHISYFDELVRIRNALSSIKDSTGLIKDDFASIEADITTIKTLGTNCSLGINTTSTWNRFSRALAVASVDSEDWPTIQSEIDNPSPLDGT